MNKSYIYIYLILISILPLINAGTIISNNGIITDGNILSYNFNVNNSILYSSIFNGFSRVKIHNNNNNNNNNNDITLGRDNVFVAFNNLNQTILKGQPVYVTGSTVDVPNIGLANSNSLNTLPAVGLALDNITSNNYGEIMKIGIIQNIDTSSFSAGNPLFVGNKTLTNILPVYPNLVQSIGSVLISSATNGSILVLTTTYISGEETGTINNFVVQKNITASYYYGDGSHLTNVQCTCQNPGINDTVSYSVCKNYKDNFIASGFGTSGVNSNYSTNGTIYNNKFIYSNIAKTYSMVYDSYQIHWMITDYGNYSKIYYRNSWVTPPTPPEPDTPNWALYGSGTYPAGTVTKQAQTCSNWCTLQIVNGIVQGCI